MRRIGALLIAVTLAAMSAGVTLANPPSSSGIVDRLVVNNAFGVFPDFNNGFWVFADVTREDFCAWLETEPDPDEAPPDIGLTPTDIQLVTTPPGAIVVLIQPGNHPLALHAMVPDAVGPCAGSEPDAWAEGSARVIVTDNDVQVSGDRANAFGVQGTGSVTDAAGGAWHYSWHDRFLVTKEGEFRILSSHTLLSPTGR